MYVLREKRGGREREMERDVTTAHVLCMEHGIRNVFVMYMVHGIWNMEYICNIQCENTHGI